jgi:hypothetical protein
LVGWARALGGLLLGWTFWIELVVLFFKPAYLRRHVAEMQATVFAIVFQLLKQGELDKGVSREALGVSPTYEWRCDPADFLGRCLRRFELLRWFQVGSVNYFEKLV